MDVWDAIRKKRAVRDFKPESLSADTVERILDAGRRSQSSKNSQPWHFIAVQDSDTLHQIAATSPNLSHVDGCALCVVICVPEENDRTIWQFFDAGQSASYMQLAALEIGVGSCLGTIYEPETIRNLLSFPADWQARLLISFGYPVEQPQRPPKKDGRRAIDDVIHMDKW